MDVCGRDAGGRGRLAHGRLCPNLPSTDPCRLVLGTSNPPRGLLVCPNSIIMGAAIRLVTVTGHQGFLVCSSGFQPMAFVAPDVTSGSRRAASPPASAGPAFSSPAPLIPLPGGRRDELRDRLPPVQSSFAASTSFVGSWAWSSPAMASARCFLRVVASLLCPAASASAMSSLKLRMWSSTSCASALDLLRRWAAFVAAILASFSSLSALMYSSWSSSPSAASRALWISPSSA
eukprot:16438842-Heterocapsa_arctica.AAC.1